MAKIVEILKSIVDTHNNNVVAISPDLEINMNDTIVEVVSVDGDDRLVLSHQGIKLPNYCYLNWWRNFNPKGLSKLEYTRNKYTESLEEMGLTISDHLRRATEAKKYNKEELVDLLLDVLEGTEEVEVTSSYIGLIINKANWMAKTIGSEYYELKHALMLALIEYDEEAHTCDNIVYVETPQGQVSFHMPPDEVVEHLENRPSTGWAGIPTQEYSYELLEEYTSSQEWRNYEFLLV